MSVSLTTLNEATKHTAHNIDRPMSADIWALALSRVGLPLNAVHSTQPETPVKNSNAVKMHHTSEAVQIFG